ncbi:adenine phosphoribosyltransferase [Colletotrichum chrysophilum]|uniref:Adenine phosphoribosyltransferase n=1 Tax=Colletotrichum chrysophilum TaxID=1836956 RepID=A0AAD9AUG9_9PEZI|nr:adenine phosphoribosyltransferase [Colletotrichum chrysophilum]
MATLDHMKRALRQQAKSDDALASQPLSDEQYSAGFKFFVQCSTAYEDFILPQLIQLLALILKSRLRVSVLEIGPGPESVLGRLPLKIRQNITRYSALEPNSIFASHLEEWLKSAYEYGLPRPCLERIVRVENSDDSLDRLIPFIAGYVPQTTATQLQWRNICRSLGRQVEAHLIFAAPEVMMAFTRHSTALPEIASRVPVADGKMQVKN